MFPKSDWLEQNLTSIGLWMTVGGIASLVGGMIGEAQYYVALAEQGSGTPPSQWLRTFWRIILDLCNPLIYNGVVLYLVGRVIGSWNVAIIGFEHSKREGLLVKGPDAGHIVWIGRRYASGFDAEAAFQALQRRFGGEAD